jgi:hypothetical protein
MTQLSHPAPEFVQPEAPAVASAEVAAAVASAEVPRRGRALAVLALTAAALQLLVGPLQVLATVAALLGSRSGGQPSITEVAGFAMIATVLMAALALALGVASLVRRERARALAGIAIGVAVAALVGLLTSALQTVAFGVPFAA